jgi:diphthamide biosynthesis protein 4
LRKAYDQDVQSGSSQPGTGPRPAHVVSLDDLLETITNEETQWTYQCRCGGIFVLTEDLLEKDVHLVSCDACSETLWVGYQVLDDDTTLTQDDNADSVLTQATI